MAKPLGPKSLLIREAIAAHPAKGNTELAEMLNGAEARKDDKLKVTANDVAQQRQALKNLGGDTSAPAAGKPAASGKKKPGRKPGPKPSPSAVAAATTRPAPAQGGPVDLIDKALDLAQQCGGLAALKRLVDRLSDMQGM